MARRVAMGFDWQGSLDRERAFERAKVADAVGVDSLWVAEAWGRDAFSLLTQLAERTERAKLGTSIVNIYSRTPGALAQHFATLDELSGGRAIIGLGNSGPRVIEHFHGVKFQPAFTRMRETVDILRAYLRHESVVYEGEIFRLERGFTLRFEPVRKEIPIYLATLNPRSVMWTVPGRARPRRPWIRRWRRAWIRDLWPGCRWRSKTTSACAGCSSPPAPAFWTATARRTTRTL